jgi:pectinesterase
MRSFITLAVLLGLAAASPIVQQRDENCSEHASSTVLVVAKAKSTTAKSTTAKSTVAATSKTTAKVTSTTASSKATSSSSSGSSARDGTTPQTGAIIVDSTGAESTYKTVQAGVDALSSSSTETQYLFIYPGTYNEQVWIPALSSALEVQGYTEDTSSYAGNTATITYNLALKDVSTNDETATLRSWNPNTKFYNLNIENTFGHINSNGQNLAVSAYTENQGYYGVQLIGYQDTLLANTGNQLYAKSLIVGAVDFIYGKEATAWFEQVDLRTIAAGSITASGRDAADNPSWYVFNSCTIAGINSTVEAESNYLGRPWRNYARVVFQNTEMSDVIKPVGWSEWSSSDTRTDNVELAEYRNTGDGAAGTRADFATTLSEAVVIGDILGSSYASESWVDTSYL